jgi:hypothetical protein
MIILFLQLSRGQSVSVALPMSILFLQGCNSSHDHSVADQGSVVEP